MMVRPRTLCEAGLVEKEMLYRDLKMDRNCHEKWTPLIEAVRWSRPYEDMIKS
jgi:hypothetical protein